MERTIDGIDYIAKSEVLRIIDEEMKDCERMISSSDTKQGYKELWAIRRMTLRHMREFIDMPKER